MSTLLAYITSSATASLLFSFLVSLAGYFVFTSLSYNFPSRAPKPVDEGWPIVGSLRFFSARWEFFQHARAQSSTGNFSFNIGKHPVIALNGEKSRKIFFENRGLGFAEGYAVLFGKSPRTTQKDPSFKEDEDFIGPGGYFLRRITRMLKTDAFGKNLPKILTDVQTRLNALERNPSGITDPFESLYEVVYQLTMRIVGCDDIAEDPVILQKTLGLYEYIENSATPTAIMFPWFPSVAVIKRTIAGGRLYMIFKNIVDERKKTGKRRDDPLQFLIDEGDSMERIIEFVVGALFAGLLNSGINVAWVVVYLASSPEWLSKARAEVQAAANKYCNDKSLPLTEQLTQLPVEAWESEFPMLDLCLKDSIRLQLLGSALRKNISGKDIDLGNGEVIPPDAFVAYHTGDVHLNPSIYSEPEKWDPSRYLPDRAEDKKMPHGYIGWGSGRHPCLGMRFAKLEQNIIMAFFLAMFDFELCDKNGNQTDKLPPVDFNGHSAQKPSPTAYIKYTRRA